MNCRTQIPAFVDSLQRKIDHHDSILFNDAEQQKESDHAVERQRRSKNPECGQAADHRGHDRWKQDRDWMDVAFVKNSENHVHHEDRADQKQRQRAEKLAKNERFALESGLHAWILLMYLRKRIFDELRRVTDRLTRQQIKIDCDAGELIEMIHRLWPDDLLCRCYRAQRNQIRAVPVVVVIPPPLVPPPLSDCASRVAAHVQIIEIAGVARSLSFTSRIT